jgi:hypothetical protein
LASTALTVPARSITATLYEAALVRVTVGVTLGGLMLDLGLAAAHPKENTWAVVPAGAIGVSLVASGHGEAANEAGPLRSAPRSPADLPRWRHARIRPSPRDPRP